jgi:hypothetical protein
MLKIILTLIDWMETYPRCTILGAVGALVAFGVSR